MARGQSRGEPAGRRPRPRRRCISRRASDRTGEADGRKGQRNPASDVRGKSRAEQGAEGKSVQTLHRMAAQQAALVARRKGERRNRGNDGTKEGVCKFGIAACSGARACDTGVTGRDFARGALARDNEGSKTMFGSSTPVAVHPVHRANAVLRAALLSSTSASDPSEDRPERRVAVTRDPNRDARAGEHQLPQASRRAAGGLGGR